MRAAMSKPDKSIRRRRRPVASEAAPSPVRRERPGAGRSEPREANHIGTDGPGQRRALSHVGGKVTFRGSATELEPVLANALKVNSDESVIRAHVHGFHSYPARLHPATALGLIEGLSKPGQVVLDPFCGSGTVLVEGALCGRQAIGVDVNPLSVLLSRVKCARASRATMAGIAKQAELAVQVAQDRRSEKALPHVRYSPYDRRWFETHVLLELDSLHAHLQRIDDPRVREPLMLVFSSLMTKVSRKAGDSAPREVGKRIASGYTIRHFADRTRELLGQLEEYAKLVGPKPPTVRTLEGDARRLQGVVDRSIDLVVTSPPYPGVFDYLEHHELRLRWLGLEADKFARNEIGSRRQMAQLKQAAIDRWREDFTKVLRSLARTLRPSGAACLVLADSVVGGQAVWADDLVPELAQNSQLDVVAIASQKRPYFHRATADAFSRRPRQEHVLVLRAGG
jgi:SAM-dependent methyltransferase